MNADIWFITGEIFIGILVALLLAMLFGMFGMVSSKRPAFWCISITVVLTIVFSCILLIPGFGMSWTTQTDIHSLKDNSMIHGRFFLGSGSIDSVPVYVYYYQLPSGGYKLSTVPVDKTVIFMDENSNPYLKTTEYKFANIYYEYEFHVPNGTIVEEYLLNSEFGR